ncbi:unnamed protein product, partial [marine sediment metagenome]
PRVIHLGQITDEIIDGWIDGWAERFEKRDGGHYCKECGSQVMQTTCYVSIHLKMFEPACAGSGKVEKINYPNSTDHTYRQVPQNYTQQHHVYWPEQFFLPKGVE